ASAPYMKSSVSLLKSTGAGFDAGGGLLQLTSATTTASGRKRCISVAAYPSAFFSRVFVGGHLIGPRGHPAEPDVDLHGRLIGSSAVPVEHVRRRIVALARAELPDCLIALL